MLLIVVIIEQFVSRGFVFVLSCRLPMTADVVELVFAHLDTTCNECETTCANWTVPRCMCSTHAIYTQLEKCCARVADLTADAYAILAEDGYFRPLHIKLWLNSHGQVKLCGAHIILCGVHVCRCKPACSVIWN